MATPMAQRRALAAGQFDPSFSNDRPAFVGLAPEPHGKVKFAS